MIIISPAKNLNIKEESHKVGESQPIFKKKTDKL